MTARAIEVAAGEGRAAGDGPTGAGPAGAAGATGGPGFRIAADRSYAARLNSAGEDCWYAERWTLDGPEPYAVPLPGPQPEGADSQVLPLADGRVLIARRTTGHHQFALLYPTGPGTGELPLGSVPAEHLTLLPPAPCGGRAYALAHEGGTGSAAGAASGEGADDAARTGIWLVVGSASGRPEQVAEVSGHCSGGAWLDGEGQLLALDRTAAQVTGAGTAGTGDAGAGGAGTRESARGGPGTADVPEQAGPEPSPGGPEASPGGPEASPGSGPVTKTVAVDLGRSGEVTPLLEITDDSNDRLLTADPDSGLLLVRSDAPGEERLGWGVLGSHRPIRFPEALHPPGLRLTPLAVQPGQLLMPESSAVAFRVDGPDGVWIAVWQPTRKELRHVGAPEGWVRDAALWTEEGELRLPVTTLERPCGLARLRPPEPREAGGREAGAPGAADVPGADAREADAGRPGTRGAEAHGTGPPDAGPPSPAATAAGNPSDAGVRSPALPHQPPYVPHPQQAPQPGRTGQPSRKGQPSHPRQSGQGGTATSLLGPTDLSSAFAAGLAAAAESGGHATAPGATPLDKAACKPVPLQQAPLTTRTG